MKLFCSLLLVVLIIQEQKVVQCMKVSKWGITSDLSRLTVSVRDLFQNAMLLITDGDLYVLPDLKHTLKQTLRNTTGTVLFRAYNGYITDLSADIVNCTEKNQLRRLTMSKSPVNKKEMFTCGDCIVLEADKFRYLYESYFDDIETHGDIYDTSIRYWVSFQMTVESNSSSTLECGMNLDSLHIRLDMENWKLEPKIRSLGRMNFMVDNINSWLIDHFNVTVSNNLHQTLSHALRFTASTHFMCDEFLSI
ncbi:hypothetical protein LSTR_LSTR003547 [Laodelphax striatellus]|uniref:Lipid-binding serum glycoprotein N-terminal domain-containing protein n=1 Tax=Laodelphax striatellus TaxID=195883 RepID=A0A482WKS9_LAOST|nr:hypothetical protein LSTR_LSTR003547 [Laodelphax striatellus]